ncbi:LLM class flavin-dependent oxidoreductase [Salinicoccus albus]|uniref:LLM class flavin-dependent oxidoreductase n=1 Tax=Salinicoccus albus TaxID=418756 RepID=UPI000372A065|nr:LLM class flavin-dependent oxidoreductase [Salinicoccus albus]
MELSILDQAPISANQTPREALQATMELAEKGESLGYTRFWVAEHHALDGLASSVPEVLLSYIGANTKRIKIGSGAVLLPYYKPYKVAETFNMLATLFPDRIDLGIGRAPGGPAEASEALSDNFLQGVFSMPEKMHELIKYTDNAAPGLTASPLPDSPPEIWMLGTSDKSAESAAEKGLSYCFGQFMSDGNTRAVIDQYRHSFQPRDMEQKPYVMLALSVVCAETTEQAEEISLSSIVWQLQKDAGAELNGIPSIEDAKSYISEQDAHETIENMKKNMIIGNPDEVKSRLKKIQSQTLADELMIVTITYSPEDKKKSYQLIAE